MKRTGGVQLHKGNGQLQNRAGKIGLRSFTNYTIFKTLKLIVGVNEERRGMVKEHQYQTLENTFQMEDFIKEADLL